MGRNYQKRRGKHSRDENNALRSVKIDKMNREKKPLSFGQKALKKKRELQVFYKLSYF